MIKRTSLDRDENFPTDAELRNIQVYKDIEKEYT
jgi:hypothetical protein